MANSLFIAFAAVAIVLGWQFYRMVGRARIAGLMIARRSTSRMVGAGQLVVGARRRAVALSVADSTLFYESSRMQASIDLDSVLAIEYDTVLAAGVDVPEGRVLRLRSEDETIEFVLPREDVSKWYLNLPPRPERVQAPGVPVAARADTPHPTAPLVWLR
jgi:hypothetical protein